MASSYSKSKGRGKSSFFAIPHVVLDHPNYLRLSSHAKALLNDLGVQYRGYNNGDLCATGSIMKDRGWKSRSTLHKALSELLYYGLIIKTRQGGKHAATLYAFTWREIDECNGKLDASPTKTSPGSWKDEKPDWTPPKKSVTRRACHVDTRDVLINRKTGENWRVLTRCACQSGKKTEIFNTHSENLNRLPGI